MRTDGPAGAGQGGAGRSARPPRRRAETRRRLLTAAFASFAERGFYGSTVEDICDRAGFTRGAFYSNFTTKEELFFELYSDRTRRLLDRIEETVGRCSAELCAASPERTGQVEADAFAEAVERLLLVQPDDRQWYLINTEFTLHAVRHPAAASGLADRRREVRARTAQLLTYGLAEMGRDLAIDLDVFVRVLFALHEGALEQSYLEPDIVPVGYLERQLIPVLLAALTTRRT
ncbi:MAG: helix-turn-helix transcriptional regulator [Dactylosporangium sp.]|nr:TetR/AcrR family transcriptional regulator; helix-turn-helix transcriptional regulator [Dactylosporangium sp.]NNJ62132.1 helix-turn-helix transcriptional regulator [Dactylosporangium sp.]